jgi:hypothetical protein
MRCAPPRRVDQDTAVHQRLAGLALARFLGLSGLRFDSFYAAFVSGV